MSKIKTIYYKSPVGILKICAEDGAVTALDVVKGKETMQQSEIPVGHVLLLACRELDEYFAGKRREFTVPIRSSGTPFREKVWAALRTIPYGETRSYGQIARQIGNAKACRAVGGANHNNPIMIITPCHRVIGGDGSLTGFGGGLEVKEYLLNLERRVCAGAAGGPEHDGNENF